MRKTGKKGSTLAELCVVLALIATASAMIASFSMLIGARTNLSTARLNAMNDLELVESATEGWMSRAGTLSIDKDGNLVDDGPYISFDSKTKTLTGTIFNGDNVEVITVQLDQVSAINYSVLGDADNYLCICTVQFDLSPDEPGQYSYSQTFCINLNVGDVYGGGQG